MKYYLYKKLIYSCFGLFALFVFKGTIIKEVLPQKPFTTDYISLAVSSNRRKTKPPIYSVCEPKLVPNNKAYGAQKEFKASGNSALDCLFPLSQMHEAHSIEIRF